MNLYSILVMLFVTKVSCLDRLLRTRNNRKGRTLFHEDQDVVVTMVIIFPYYFPLWERFYNTSVEQGTDAAIAEFPNLPPEGLPVCGVFCRKRRSQMERTGRFFQYDEQVVHFLLEMIAAFPVPIIPNPYAAANRKPMRMKNGFSPLMGLNGLREVAGLFGMDNGESGMNGNADMQMPQGMDNIGVQAPIGMFPPDGSSNGSPIRRPNRPPVRFGSLGPIIPSSTLGFGTQGITIEGRPPFQPFRTAKTSDNVFDSETEPNTTEVRNLCISDGINFQSSRSIKDNCFVNTKNSRLLSAYETVTIDRKRMVSQMRLNLSSLLAAMGCHFTEWYLKKTNYFIRSFFFGTIRTICTNTNLVRFFTVVHKICKCLMHKKLI